MDKIDRPVIQRIHPVDWLQRSSADRPVNLLGYLVDPGAGQGDPFDWQRVLSVQPQTRLTDAWLAGGLDPRNVRYHIRMLQPAVVDVCSSVEQAGYPGIKSLKKVELLLQQVRNQTIVRQ